MMMDQGLAQQSAQQITVEQVIELLMQGVAPEELVQQGVPVELIEQAIQVIMAQEQQAQPVQPANTEQGLAMSVGAM